MPHYQSVASPTILLATGLLCSGRLVAEYLSPAPINIFKSVTLKQHIETQSLGSETLGNGENDEGYTTCAFKNVSHADTWFKVIQTDHTVDAHVYHVAGKSFIKNCRYCFSFWTQNEETKHLIGQGCWFSGDSCDSDCDGKHLAISQKDQKEEAMFCCCHGDMCNMKAMDNSNNINNNNKNVNKQEEAITTAPGAQVSSFRDNEKRTYVISILTVILISVAVIMIFFSLLIKPRKKAWPDSPEDGRVLLDPASDIPPRSLANLRLVKKVRKGHFGSVYKATVEESTLAVKVFPSKNHDYFLNEKNIYTLPHMKHPGIVEYFGDQEQKSTAGEGQDLMLFFSWAYNGSLQQYLKKNIISWKTFCQMAKSLVEGLVHLHSTINKNGKFKPGISHRDINSGNILVKSDLSCCICDMGFAMKLCDSTAEDVRSSGLGLSKGSGTLFGVGSIRYMAPEELDGSLNMKDWEQALKQVDIYALGLVLWELAKRCYDLYQGSEVAVYEEAFQSELGLRPNFEEIQNLISRNKARPLFPEVWKMTNPAVASLRETIEECWDPEPDARLSSHSVLERICQLPSLWNGCENVGTDTNVRMDNVRSKQWIVEHIEPHQGANLCIEKNLAINTEKNAEFVVKSTKKELSNDLNNRLDSLSVNKYVNFNNMRRQHCVPVSLSPSITYFQNSVKSTKNTNLISVHTSQNSILESYGRPEMQRSRSELLHMLDHPTEPLSHVVRINTNVPTSQPNQTTPNLQSDSTENREESKSNLVRAENLRIKEKICKEMKM